MDQNTEAWRQYYERSMSRPHSPATEVAVGLNETGLAVAVDCGCGTGSDIDYLVQQGYAVHGFDSNADSIAICQSRFHQSNQVVMTQASFETFDYPEAGIVVAHSSLFFAEPESFESTWMNLASCLEDGGVFAGDFMGPQDDWASGYRSATTPLTEQQVMRLFDAFEIVRFRENCDIRKTVLGKEKQWHTFSIVAVKRA